MIAVDTSIWVDHFREGNDALTALLAGNRVAQHPFVTGELAMGSLHDWQNTVADLRGLPKLAIVSDDGFFAFMVAHQLAGRGLGFVDVHLLAAVTSVAGLKLWTRDARMASVAEGLGVTFSP